MPQNRARAQSSFWRTTGDIFRARCARIRANSALSSTVRTKIRVQTHDHAGMRRAMPHVLKKIFVAVSRRAARTRLKPAQSATGGPASRTGRNLSAHGASTQSPPINGRLEQFRSPCRLLGKHGDDDRVGRGEFVVGGVACHDPHACGRSIRRLVCRAHSGMFPCFFGGRLARLPFSARRALMIATRVAAGSMMPSSSPRSAAKNGLATL